MATPPQPATAATPGAAAPVRSSRKILLALAVLTALAGGGGATFFVLRGTAVRAASAPEPVTPLFVTLEPLTVNVVPDARQRFLHVGVTLKVSDEKAQARVNEAMPELRSRLLLLLSNRDPAGLASLQDKLALAEQIRNELNRPVAKGQPAQGIDGVGFTAFVLQ